MRSVTNGAEGISGKAYDEWGRDPDAAVSIRLAAWGIVRYLRAVYATTRGVCLQPDFHQEATASPGGTYIAVFWHHHVALASFFYPAGIRRVCLVSRSKDGELLAQTVALLGSHCVRGSSSALDGRNKGGASALREMVRAAEEGFHPVVTPDGPKGPPESVKMGVVSLAGLTGRPVVPIGFAASRCFRLSSWDKTVFPLPFTRIVVSYGEPVEVPQTQSGEVLESRRAELERRLLAANREAEESLRSPEQKSGS